MDKIKGVFFDLGGTLRIVEKVPEHQERAKVRMAELVGRTDVQDFIDMVEERYAPYRDWALTENKEAGDFELWDKWLLPELDKERLAAVCHELTYQYRQVKGLRHVVPGGLQVIRGLYERGFRLGIISNLIGENEIPDWLREDGLAQYFDAALLRVPYPETGSEDLSYGLRGAGPGTGGVRQCGRQPGPGHHRRQGGGHRGQYLVHLPGKTGEKDHHRRQPAGLYRASVPGDSGPSHFAVTERGWYLWRDKSTLFLWIWGIPSG